MTNATTTDARISTALPAHPKTKKLRRRLGGDGCWALTCLFLWAAGNRSDGDLDGLTDEDIELAADWRGDANGFVTALVDLRFLDGDEGARRIHDWAEHNPWAAGAEMRSTKGKFGALCKQHGRTFAEKQMPEYVAMLKGEGASGDEPKATGGKKPTNGTPPADESGASGMPVPESGSAPSPTPLPIPSPLPSPSPKSNTLPQQAGGETPAKVVYTAGFLKVWDLYPNKQGKAEAFKSWRRQKLEALADEIAADVTARAATDREWLDQGGKYIPHGSTYINGRRWEDAINGTPRVNGSTGSGYQPMAGER